ncbi:MAG: DUF2849 domain-containing protein [Pseudomonadota bacterium]
MKAITGNRLGDGAVIYLSPEGGWTLRLSEAALFEKEAAAEALKACEARETEIVGPYLMDAEQGGVASGQKHLRESIRAAGPTIRVEPWIAPDDSASRSASSDSAS